MDENRKEDMNERARAENDTFDYARDHMPSIKEPGLLLAVLGLSVVGAIIGLQLIVTLGISAHTAILGALVAIVFSRIPLTAMRRFRSIERQNLIQTAVSSATFGAANSLMIPIGVPFAMGMSELIIPMLIGAMFAMFIDASLLYGMFGSRTFPAYGTWPAGIATAEAIQAGDQGGKKAAFLGVGIGTGLLGASLGVPMSAFGVAFIGNVWALSMFGIGLLVSGYSMPLFNININEIYLPHGFMIGAGLVALGQVIMQIRRRDKAAEEEYKPEEHPIGRWLAGGFILYLGVAVFLTIVAGLTTDMGTGMLLLFVVYAAFAAFVHEIIVGIAAMHSGWFPAFAVALITLIGGMLLGFPPVALGILAGYSAATGPAFADMGYDLKTGWILRGKGSNPSVERYGRRQQYIVAMLAFVVAAATVALTHKHFFAQNLFPPVDKVYATTIQAGISSEIGWELAKWVIPGALLQFIGGSKRQLGVLLSTGLLLKFPAAGWAVLAGIALRLIIRKLTNGEKEAEVSAMAGGFIASDALYHFFTGVVVGKK